MSTTRCFIFARGLCIDIIISAFNEVPNLVLGPNWDPVLKKHGWTPRPTGRGGFPVPRGGGSSLPRAVGRGRFPAQFLENDQNRGEVAGQNKDRNLKFLQ